MGSGEIVCLAECNLFSFLRSERFIYSLCDFSTIVKSGMNCHLSGGNGHVQHVFDRNLDVLIIQVTSCGGIIQ